MTDKLASQQAFAGFQRTAIERWERMWDGDQLVVSVQVDSSSVAKSAERVLAACREALAGSDAIVREVSGNGAMWMEPAVEVKRPGEPPIVYGWITPEDVPALLAGKLADRTVGVRGAQGYAGIPPVNEHPLFKH